MAAAVASPSHSTALLVDSGRSIRGSRFIPARPPAVTDVEPGSSTEAIYPANSIPPGRLLEARLFSQSAPACV